MKLTNLDISDRFVYESLVYSYNQNVISIIDSAIYESDSPIDGIIRSYFITKNIEICTNLISAPLYYIKTLED